jgi:hypothetical protein
MWDTTEFIHAQSPDINSSTVGLTSHFKAIVFLDMTSDIPVDNYKQCGGPAASFIMKIVWES